MEPDCVVPIHEIVKIIESKSVLFVSIIPLFNFAIDLRAFNWRQYVNYFIPLKEIFKFAVSIAIFVPLIGIELSPMVCHHLADRCQPAIILKCLLKESDAVFGCFRIEFSTCKNAPRTIIEDDANLLSITISGVPIQMYKA